jgi:hypothetical protein
MAETGRPTDYNEALADAICEELENSPRGLDHICKAHPDWPTGRTVRRWLKQIPAFRPKYALAKENQADFCTDEMLEIAYDDRKDWKVIVDDEGNEKTVFVAESCNRSRLKIDTLKWHASKLAPKKYGDAHKTEHGVSESVMQNIIDKL